jgi:hypothetical protein
LNRLRWGAANLGAILDCPRLIQDAVKASQLRFATVRGPAATPPLALILLFEHIATAASSSSVEQYVAACFCLVLWTGLRLKDLQRSRLVRATPEFLYCDMTRTKSPKAPTSFVCPRSGLSTNLWSDPLTRTRRASVHLLCELSGPLSDPATTWLLSPASYTHICEWLRLLQQLPGVSGLTLPASPVRLTGHSCRHWMATIGDLLDLPEPRLNLLGRWAAARNRDGSQARKYSSARLEVTVQTIFAIQRAVRLAFCRVGPALSFHDLCPGDVSYCALAVGAGVPSSPAASIAAARSPVLADPPATPMLATPIQAPLPPAKLRRLTTSPTTMSAIFHSHPSASSADAAAISDHDDEDYAPSISSSSSDSSSDSAME